MQGSRQNLRPAPLARAGATPGRVTARSDGKSAATSAASSSGSSPAPTTSGAGAPTELKEARTCSPVPNPLTSAINTSGSVARNCSLVYGGNETPFPRSIALDHQRPVSCLPRAGRVPLLEPVGTYRVAAPEYGFALVPGVVGVGRVLGKKGCDVRRVVGMPSPDVSVDPGLHIVACHRLPPRPIPARSVERAHGCTQEVTYQLGLLQTSSSISVPCQRLTERVRSAASGTA